jgi:hypothetical protein
MQIPVASGINVWSLFVVLAPAAAHCGTLWLCGGVA